jgi:hypothetical protein
MNPKRKAESPFEAFVMRTLLEAELANGIAKKRFAYWPKHVWLAYDGRRKWIWLKSYYRTWRLKDTAICIHLGAIERIELVLR